MHHYIQYLFIIFGSVSIMFGCDSNNNNYSEADISNKHIYCRCCNPTTLFEIGPNGQRKGLFTNKESFRTHFKRNHRLEIQKFALDKVLATNYMGTITDDPITEEVFKKIRAQLKAEWASKNTPSLPVPNSPLPMPMGSPSIFQNNDSPQDGVEAFNIAVSTLVAMKKNLR